MATDKDLEKRKEEIVDCIQNFLMKDCDEENRNIFAIELMFEALIFGSANYLEAYGILKVVGDNYDRVWTEVMEEEEQDIKDSDRNN